MAKRVIWSLRAQNDRKAILEYWHKRNGNKNYSKKLAMEFRETVSYIAEHNYLGVATDEENVRIAVCGHYLIFYELKKEAVEILTVWDSRRNFRNLTLE
ncbi:MAG: type II toxin-antitoxin system RelE/ParE family toxin [Nitrospirota bacterium]